LRYCHAAENGIHGLLLQQLTGAKSMAEDRQRVADDFEDGIGPVTIELFKVDNRQNRRKVYRQFEMPEDQRIKGLFKISPRRVACVPSVVRADLARRAGSSNP
jgi:hypothetical protein